MNRLGCGDLRVGGAAAAAVCVCVCACVWRGRGGAGARGKRSETQGGAEEAGWLPLALARAPQRPRPPRRTPTHPPTRPRRGAGRGRVPRPGCRRAQLLPLQLRHRRRGRRRRHPAGGVQPAAGGARTQRPHPRRWVAGRQAAEGCRGWRGGHGGAGWQRGRVGAWGLVGRVPRPGPALRDMLRACAPGRAANLGGVPVAAVGEAYDLTYPVEQLGEGADTLDKLVKAGRCGGGRRG